MKATYKAGYKGVVWRGEWYKRKKARMSEAWRNANTGEVSSRPKGPVRDVERRRENVYGGDSPPTGLLRTLNYRQQRGKIRKMQVY